MQQISDNQQTGAKASVLRSAVWVSVITLLITAAWCAWVWFEADQDFKVFAWLGTYFTEDDPNGNIGYDGQFYYLIARDGADSIPILDGASFRLQRILYPLVGRLLAFGQPDFVGFTLILINVVAHSITTGLLAYLVSRTGVNPYWTLFYAVWYGALVGVRFDLTEPLCFVLAMGAIVAVLHQRYWLTLILLVLSVFAKEIGVVFAVGIALWLLQQRKWLWVILYAVVPVTLLLGWWQVLYSWLNESPMSYPGAKFSLIPFGGMILIRDALDLFFAVLWLLAPMAFITWFWLHQLIQTRRLSLNMALWFVSVGFVATLAGAVWQDPVATYRVATPVVLVGYWLVCEHFPRYHRVFVFWWGSSVVFFVLLLQQTV